MLVNGLLILLASLLFDPLLGQPFGLGVVQLILIGIGLVVVGLAIVGPIALWPKFPGPLTLTLPTLFLSLVIVEAAFRIAGHDFGRELEALQKVPIYYRQPRVPVGDIYFRRDGPAVWTGDVLANDVHVTVAYDSLGFRNPPELEDWEIVVVGDSFVELGYLTWGDLFTTAIGKHLDLRVKNLGVSHVGPLTYNFYLSSYGKAPSTTEAICVFFEGNDLNDLEREMNDLTEYRETGLRPTRNVKKTTSFLKASSILINRVTNRFIPVDPGAIRESQRYNAFFVSAAETIAVGVGAESKHELSPDQESNLKHALARWASEADALGLRPWLAYMPSKRRVLHGHLRFQDNVPQELVAYDPSNLPKSVKDLCAEHGIGFIDLSLSLRAAADRGVLPFNETDAHLSLSGCRVVAETVAEELARHGVGAGN